MAKRKKGNRRQPTIAGMQGPGQVGGAGSIARTQESFSGQGVNPRVQKAASKVRQLVGKGYRLNPKAKTSQTYKDAVKEANSPAGKLKKALGFFR